MRANQLSLLPWTIINSLPLEKHQNLSKTNTRTLSTSSFFFQKINLTIIRIDIVSGKIHLQF